MRAARVARLFFLTRPIKFLICGVVVAVAVVDAKASYSIDVNGNDNATTQEFDWLNEEI